jgi:hypothetical protein
MLSLVLSSLLVAQAGQGGVVHVSGLGLAFGAPSEAAEGLSSGLGINLEHEFPLGMVDPEALTVMDDGRPGTRVMGFMTASGADLDCFGCGLFSDYHEQRLAQALAQVNIESRTSNIEIRTGAE